MRLYSQSGFTLIELAVTIAIMAILLSMAVWSISDSQEKSRDEDRRADVNNIVTYLDSGYNTGFTGLGNMRGSYPSTGQIASNDISNVFSDFDIENLQAPDTDPSSHSLVVATNSNDSPTGVRPVPSIDTYVYQPIDVDGALCTSASTECRKFNLFYSLETEEGVQKLIGKNR